MGKEELKYEEKEWYRWNAQEILELGNETPRCPDCGSAFVEKENIEEYMDQFSITDGHYASWLAGDWGVAHCTRCERDFE